MAITFSNSAPPLDMKDVAEVERELGLRLPQTYLDFLRQHNGGEPTPDLIDYLWIGDDPSSTRLRCFLSVSMEPEETVMQYLGIYAGRIPLHLLPVASDGFDNVICLSLSGDDEGKVFIWKHGEEIEVDEYPELAYINVYPVADSFSEFLEKIHE